MYPGGIRKLSDEQEERLKETIAKQRTVDARFEAKCTWTFVHGSFASSARNIP
ncbi:transposase-like protein [Paenibacillus sp. FSL H8-237]|nr:transposase-like protein [Paenibacillus sp. FSL H8-237]